MITEVITFWGTVQGVGFRPTLSRIAAKHRMKGQVRNMGGFVQLIVTDEPARIDAFLDAVRAGRPRMADIIRIDREVIDTVRFDAFDIVSSAAAEDEIAAVPADIAVCDACLAEFRDPDNPRYLHPFISCTDCGPRYTIMERLPYDRDTTTMDDFPMCGFCESEYTDSATRRYHAQTISCHACGPQPIWVDRSGAKSDAAGAIAAIRAGGVVAFKGVGGYYLVCSPYDEAAVQKLRDIKVREHKPFAVMFPSTGDVRAYCEVGAGEEALLTSPRRPIVLLERKDAANPPATPFARGVCSTSRFLGAFLPSMALQYLLTDALGPLVMTSANISDLPIIRDDDEAFALLGRDGRVAGILYNERRIVRRLDDSVARVIDGAPQLTRRSKGWTPVPVYVRGTDRLTRGDQILATGGHLKSAFALTKGSFVYMSQHIGDIDNVETERVFRENLASMKEFFGIEPRLVAHDMHPLYWTTGYAAEYARAHGAELLPVQHHHAHVASVMAEHGLEGPVIGVAFDGTGYGTDGTIWGGEILVCEGAGFERFSHLRQIEMIGGDASMRDAWKSAVSHLAAREAQTDAAGRGGITRVTGVPETVFSSCSCGKPSREDALGCNRQTPWLQTHSGDAPPPRSVGPRSFDIDISDIVAYAREHDTLADYRDERRAVEAAIAENVNTVTTSSMGRLFDAACSLLGIHHVNRYEGECAILLENAAHDALCGQAGEAQALALDFHRRIARAVLTQCALIRAERDITGVCLSGGVFQNRILMEETLRLLRAEGFTPYYNTAVPPNDGGVALGQALVAMRRLR